VRVRFSDPLARRVGEDYDELIASARSVIEATLLEWRAADA
jgi:hypothetical protein